MATRGRQRQDFQGALHLLLADPMVRSENKPATACRSKKTFTVTIHKAEKWDLGFPEP